MILYELTWDEVAKLDRQTVVLVLFGAVEQHSLHLPLGTDSIIVETIARRLEADLPNEVLLLPIVWLGGSRHHMHFAGSLTAEIETFIKTGEEIVDSLFQHGFRNFILLNGHGGNATKIDLMAERLRHRNGSSLKVVGVTYWNLIGDQIQAIRDTPLGGMGHACELETSLMLAAHADLVRVDRMEADGPLRLLSQFETQDMFKLGSVSVPRTAEEMTRHGGFGDPTTASSTKGERIFNVILAKLVQVVREIRSGAL